MTEDQPIDHFIQSMKAPEISSKTLEIDPFLQSGMASDSRNGLFMAFYVESHKLSDKFNCVEYIQMLFFTMQILGLVFCPYHPGFLSDTSLMGIISRFLYQFTTFTFSGTVKDISIISFILPFIINIFLYVVLTFSANMYKTSMIASTAFTALVFIILHVIPFSIFVPVVARLPIYFIKIASQTGLSMTGLILSLLSLTYSYITLRALLTLFNHSTRPTKSLISTFNGRFKVRLVISTSLIAMISTISAYAKTPIVYILLYTCREIILVYMVYLCFELPCARLNGNAFLAACTVAQISVDICLWLYMAGLPILDMFKFFTFIIVYIISYFVFKYLFKRKINSYGNFEESRIPKFERAALTMLHAAYINNSPRALSGILGYEIATKFDNASTWLEVASLTAFLPSNEPQLDKCLCRMRQMPSRDKFEQMVHCHLVNLAQSRSKNASERMKGLYDKLTYQVENAYLTGCGFWARIAQDPLSTGQEFVEDFASAVESTKPNLKHATQVYPSDATIAMLYAKFQRDVLCRPEKAIKWARRSVLLKGDAVGDVDYLFKAFVRANPHILKTNIVGLTASLAKGLSIEEERNEIIDDGTEALVLDDFPDNVVKNALAKATNDFKPKGFSTLRTLKLVSILATGISILYYIVTFSSRLSMVENSAHIINVTGEMMMATASLRLFEIMRWGFESGKIFNGGLSPSDYMKSETQTLLEMVSELYMSFSNIDDTSLSAGPLLNTSGLRIICQSDATVSSRQPISFRSGVITAAWRSFDLALMPDSEFVNLETSQAFCEVDQLLRVIIDEHLNFINKLTATQIQQISYQRYSAIRDCLIGIGVWLLIFLPLILIPIKHLQNVSLKVLKVLQNIPQDAAKAASEGQNPSRAAKKSSVPVTLIYTVGMSVSVLALVISAILFATYDAEGLLLKLTYSVPRVSVATHLFTQAMMAAMSVTNPPPWSTAADEMNEFKRITDQLIELHQNAITPRETIDKCNNSETFYGCMGMDRLISTLMIYTRTVSEGGLDSPVMQDIGMMIENDIRLTNAESDKIITTELLTKASIVTIVSTILCVVGLIFLFILLFTDAFLTNKAGKTLQTTLLLLRRLPVDILGKLDELDGILFLERGKEKLKRSDPMRIVFESSSKGVACLDSSLVFTATNPAFDDAFGLARGQMVGRPLTDFVKEPESYDEKSAARVQAAGKLYEKLKAMINGEATSEVVYDVNTIDGLPATIRARQIDRGIVISAEGTGAKETVAVAAIGQSDLLNIGAKYPNFQMKTCGDAFVFVGDSSASEEAAQLAEDLKRLDPSAKVGIGSGTAAVDNAYEDCFSSISE